jgi:2-hydroxy-6-oxonona-2,4-dienedioate hydrolase
LDDVLTIMSTQHSPTTTATDTSPSEKVRSITLSGLSGTPVKADVIDWGAGKPVVFLHGLVGLNDHWEDSAKRISDRRRVVMLQLPLLDLRGDDCSIHGATELTCRFLDQYLREPAVLVGNSFGGHVALGIALARPDLVRGLVLAGASGLIEKSMVREIQIHPTRDWLEEKIGELFFDRSKMRMSDVDRAHGELTQKRKARAMVKLSRSARRNHLGDKIGDITIPTQLIWGRQDIVTPPEACEQFHSKIKDSRVAWLDNCGHAPMIECPELFGDALVGFLDELDLRNRR